MPAKPKILNQREAARSRFFYVEEVDLEFSNGVKRTYERLRTGGYGAVMMVPMLDPETVLMIREYSVGFTEYQLTLPKGAVDPGETVEQAANRELMEEVGYGAKKLQVIRDLSLSPSYMEHSITALLAEDLYEQRLSGDEPEPLEVVPVKLSELSDLAMRAEFTEARAIAALYLARDILAKR